MTFLGVIGKIFGAGGRFGLRIFKFKISWLLIFFFIIFIQAGIVSYQERSFTPFFTKIAGEFVLATDNLNTQSMSVIGQNGIWNRDLGFFSRIWDFIVNIWYYLKSILFIYFWIKVLMLVFLYGLIMDTSKAPTAWGFAIVIFLLTQPLLMVLFGERLGGSGDPWIVFTSFKNFFISLPYIFSPASTVAERFARDAPGNLSVINNTLNMT
jgi:hypothetical protein